MNLHVSPGDLQSERIKSAKCLGNHLGVSPWVSYIAHKTLSTNPGLETCSVQAAGNSNSVKVDIGNIGEFVLALAEGSD